MKGYFYSRVEHMVRAMDEVVYALERYKSEVADSKYYYAAQKKAEEVVESAISINQDLLFDRFEHLPKSYRDSFLDLDKTNAFSKDELEKLANTAGFRNRLAHQYLELDPQITVESMESILALYPVYIEKIRAYLN